MGGAALSATAFTVNNTNVMMVVSFYPGGGGEAVLRLRSDGGVPPKPPKTYPFLRGILVKCDAF